MGADLYIKSIFDANRKRYQPRLDEWVQKREELAQAGQVEAMEAAQEKVIATYHKMYEKGYFRDSYNASCLLWKFGLSWWADVGAEWVDERGNMSPENAEHFLQCLAEREPSFRERLQDDPVWEGWTRAEMTQYFQDKYRRLQVFLREAMAREEAILCSI